MLLSCFGLLPDVLFIETTNQSGTTATPTQETKSEQTEKKRGFRDWLKRNKTRIACIAGGLATGAVAGLTHIPYVASGAMLLGATSGLSTRLLSYLYNKDMEKLKATTDEKERKQCRFGDVLYQPRGAGGRVKIPRKPLL